MGAENNLWFYDTQKAEYIEYHRCQTAAILRSRSSGPGTRQGFD